MPTIPVPAPPKSAFNKNRPVSDLLQHQLRHFHHVESRLPPELRSNMSSRDLSTENGAARYIAHVTNALESLHQPRTARPTPIPIRRTTRPAPPISIAAAAGPAPSAAKPSARRKSAGSAQSFSTPETPPKTPKDGKPKGKPRRKKP